MSVRGVAKEPCGGWTEFHSPSRTGASMSGTKLRTHGEFVVTVVALRVKVRGMVPMFETT